jgi:hypothetical protein
MKGQTETINLVLLFSVGVVLFISAVVWGRTILQQNIDNSKISFSENFMTSLDKKIGDVVKFGGDDKMGYGFDSTIELIGDNTIEIKTPTSVTTIPNYWVNVTNFPESYIREMLDGNVFRIQLVLKETSYNKISLFTDGPKLATPKSVELEKNSTKEDNGIIKILVKITFL